jgi:hypothetical protein
VSAVEVSSLYGLTLPQRRLRNRPALATAILIMALALTGCAETPAAKAQRLDPLIAAAGFRLVQANSPRKQAVFTALPPLKMTYYIGRDGQPHYWFADPYQCMCVYQGNAKAYQQYQNLRIQQRIAEEQEETAALNQDTAIQMNTFDPFFFPY